MSLIPRNYADTHAAWLEALLLARALGARILQLGSGYWHEDEPSPGTYRWDPMQRLIDDVLEQPDDVAGVVARLVELTGDTPISIAGGWSSSSSGGGGSEAQQAAFFSALFTALRRHSDRIDYVAVGTLLDDDLDIVGPAYRAQFDYLPKDFVEQIIDSISKLGLLREDATPKPAWSRLRELVVDYYGSAAVVPVAN